MTLQRAHISGPRLDQVEGLLVREPSVGDSMQLLLDDGKLMRTSQVREVRRDGAQLIVDTLNSRYELRLLSAA